MSLIDSYFYPYRVSGKSWIDLPEINRFLREQILSGTERIIPKNTALYGKLPSFTFRPEPDQVLVGKDIPVLLLDESTLLEQLRPIAKKYGFRSIQPNDLQEMFRQMGVTGYITPDQRIILLQPEILSNKTSNCLHQDSLGW